jgi:mannose-1-phosphate guanylyltransferase
VCRFTDRIDLGGETAGGLFIGVQVMSPSIFARMPTRAGFEIIPDVYLPALRAGIRIGTWLQPTRQPWWPVGTPSELLDANLAALRQEVGADAVHQSPDARVEGKVTGPVWIGAGAVVEAGARVGPGAVISARSRVARGAELLESLVLPGAEVAAGAVLERAIAFDKEVWRDD